MPVRITSNFDDDSIKNEQACMKTIVETTLSESMGHSLAGNYHANSLNCAKTKLVQDFISVPITCKFDEDPIKNEFAIIRKTTSPLYV